MSVRVMPYYHWFLLYYAVARLVEAFWRRADAL